MTGVEQTARVCVWGGMVVEVEQGGTDFLGSSPPTTGLISRDLWEDPAFWPGQLLS